MSKKDRKKALQPVEEELRKLRWKLQYLEDLREAKIPFWQKLPKESQFYVHYVQMLYNNSIKDAATELVTQDQQLMTEVKEEVQRPVPVKKLDAVEQRRLELLKESEQKAQLKKKSFWDF